MAFKMIRADITELAVDAIVNAANSSLLGGSGVDGAIHRAAGPQLLAECRTLGGCPTGQAKLTAAYQLPAKYVIHTVGPIWQNGQSNEAALLADCYRHSLALAKQKQLTSVAFPLISAGAYGYPKAAAIRIALLEIANFLKSNDMTIYLVLYSQTLLQLAENVLADLADETKSLLIGGKYESLY